MIVLGAELPPDTTSWFDARAAAVAVDAICVRQGKAGRGYFGKSLAILVSVFLYCLKIKPIQ